MSYIGRFAPSPTGPLHFGSLLAALASYLEARHAGGQWRVRIEDVDRLREAPGAADRILRSLESFGLLWDGEVVRQSAREPLYYERLAELRARGLIYRCACSRTSLQARGSRHYDGYCRQHPPAASARCALRLRVDAAQPGFEDGLLGPVAVLPELADEDFIVMRKEGFWSYQFAVVADDIAQGVSHIVRGADLIESTPGQIALYRLLGQRPPQFLHIPLALGADGQKLSKQSHAAPLEDGSGEQLRLALDFLGQRPPADLTLPELMAWARQYWCAQSIPRCRGRVPPV